MTYVDIKAKNGILFPGPFESRYLSLESVCRRGLPSVLPSSGLITSGGFCALLLLRSGLLLRGFVLSGRGTAMSVQLFMLFWRCSVRIPRTVFATVAMIVGRLMWRQGRNDVGALSCISKSISICTWRAPGRRPCWVSWIMSYRGVVHCVKLECVVDLI